MADRLRDRLKDATGAEEILEVDVLQPLWNNYGKLCRVHLRGAPMDSVIIKHIQIPEGQMHPRGFGGSLSSARKVKSYEVEKNWYEALGEEENTNPRTASCLSVFAQKGELFLVLEDLQCSQFYPRPYLSGTEEVRAAIEWLAEFHAKYLGHSGKRLWEKGTYWHLDTRPEELKRIQGTELHRYASFLDARLQSDAFDAGGMGTRRSPIFYFPLMVGMPQRWIFSMLDGAVP